MTTSQPVRVLLIADMRLAHSIGWASGLLDMQFDLCIQSSRVLSESDRDVLWQRLPRSSGVTIHEPSDIWNQQRPRFASRTRASSSRKATARSALPGTGRLETPVELGTAKLVGRQVARLEKVFRPDVVHGLRIPFEGIAGAYAKLASPLAVSIWGQDLVAQAPANPLLARATRTALSKAAGVHADCRRDLDLAPQWGMRDDAIGLLAPGNFGVDPATFHPGNDHGIRQRWGIPTDSQVVLNPRRPAGWVQWREFIHGFALAAEERGDIHGVMLAAKGYEDAEELVSSLGLGERMTMLPEVSRQEVADLLRTSSVVVSLTTSDGTPNSVLEAMASGIYPVVGDVDSLRDVVIEGSGGEVLSEVHAHSVAAAILKPIVDRALAESVRQANLQRVSSFHRDRVAHSVLDFYRALAHPRADRAS